MPTRKSVTHKTNVAIYARVSTADQDCAMQLTELNDFAARMGWAKPAEYVDKASGKAGAKRPAQAQLMSAVRMRQIDVLLIWKMDRFGRSLSELAQNIQILDQSGVRLLIPSQSIDTDNKSPMGKLIVGLFGLLAEFERALIVERVAAGVKQSQLDYKAGRIGKDKHTRSGKDLPSGRPRKIFRRDEAAALKAQGKSLRAIAKLLGVPFTTIADALRGGK
jgi:DNA invertase Pin-like site-specific DNA recombinase